jgi:chromosome transmission fidelity protein 1
LPFQVCGYANKLSSIQNQFDLQLHDEGSSIACFQALIDFLRSLLNSNDDGRIIVAKQKLGGQPDEAYIKFVMLCAEKIFSEVLNVSFLSGRVCIVATYKFYSLYLL